MRDLRCMSYLGKGNATIIVAGCQDIMLKIDVEKGKIVEQVSSQLGKNVFHFWLNSFRFRPSMNIR